MKDLGSQFKDIWDDYSTEIQEASAEALNKSTDYTIENLKKDSPRDKHRKKYRVGKPRYANGWKVMREDIGVNNVRAIIWNDNDPTLTHLLEYGHVLVRNGRVIGRTRAFPHIEPNQEKGAEYYEKELKKKIENIK